MRFGIYLNMPNLVRSKQRLEDPGGTKVVNLTSGTQKRLPIFDGSLISTSSITSLTCYTARIPVRMIFQATRILERIYVRL